MNGMKDGRKRQEEKNRQGCNNTTRVQTIPVKGRKMNEKEVWNRMSREWE
jgi:hypothetical protein